MTKTPAVSVLMPVRDEERHVGAAIRSILEQTFRDLELVIVDDGSTDDTPDLVRRFADRDPRVHVLSQPPSGIVPALERARAESRGRYLARMDADDIALPQRIDAQYALMESVPELVGCGCGVEYFSDGPVRDGARRYEAWINSVVSPEAVSGAMFVECPVAHPTFFLRAEAAQEVGGYRDRGWPEDYDLILRLWAAGGRLGKVPNVLLRWREGEGRLSRTHPRYSPEAFRRCKVHFLRRTLLQGRSGVVIWGAGPVGKAFSRELSEAGTGVSAFVEVDPRKIGQEIHGAPVVTREEGLSLQGVLHLASVGQVGERATLLDLFREAGLIELEDFVAVA